jgi:hypothetical protein
LYSCYWLSEYTAATLRFRSMRHLKLKKKKKKKIIIQYKIVGFFLAFKFEMILNRILWG